MEHGSRGAVANAIIAGVNKAGTTSLFVSLSGHPQIAAASIKETCYFLPLRWGEALAPRSVYESYFPREPNRPIRLEATPGYFYGGTPIVSAMREVCGDDLKIMFVLREPVARFVSYFKAQKLLLQVPPTLTVKDYLATADQLSDEDFRDPSNLKWFGYRGGCYADFLTPWIDAFGDDLHVIFFDDLIARSSRVLHEVAGFLDIDPGSFATAEIASENRTTGFRNRALQRFALDASSRFEPFFRRHYLLKRTLRAAYYRINGQHAAETVPSVYLETLQRRYADSNARLAPLLAALNHVELPPWLTGTGS